MAIKLKEGMSEELALETSYRVTEVVANILQGITEHGDAHVRELSEKFDDWSPASFRLSDD